jgi:DNA-binding response OmpR family regulator
VSDGPSLNRVPPPPARPAPPGPPVRVLIVEDDATVRELLREWFARGDFGYVVDVAATGGDALEVAHRRRPSIVLLDIGLPDFSGLDVLKLVRQLQATIPVIVITGTRDVAIAAEAAESGAFAYIPKPVSIAYVEHLVAAALRGGSRKSPLS